MRRTATSALLLLLAALAGCGSGPTTAARPAAGADRFHEKDANATPSPDKLPLKYTSADGRAVDLTSYRDKLNVVLVVVKGQPEGVSGFCPGCLAQVNALAANYDEIKARDAEVLLVFPGTKDKLSEYVKAGRADGQGGNPSVQFPVLLDPDLEAVDALGIRGFRARQSTFIIDKRGDVVFGYVGDPRDNYDRPSVKAVLAQLDRLNAARK